MAYSEKNGMLIPPLICRVVGQIISYSNSCLFSL
jgi:hypothetical protein